MLVSSLRTLFEAEGFNEFIDLFRSINTGLTVAKVALTVIAGLILGLVILFTYKITCKGLEYDNEFAITLLIMPIVVSLIMAVIGSSLPKALSLAGLVAIARFRSWPMKPKSVAFIFYALGAGVAAGSGLLVPGLVFVLIMAVILVVASVLMMPNGKNEVRTLKIAVPESLNFDGMFDEILAKYTNGATLDAVKVISGGTVVELCYLIKIKDMSTIKLFMDEIRTKNANFNVFVTQRVDIVK